MKKVTIISLAFLLVSFTSFLQENTLELVENENFNELKLNMTNLIAFKWFDVAYERTINEESSIGVGLLTRIDSDIEDSRGFI